MGGGGSVKKWGQISCSIAVQFRAYSGLFGVKGAVVVVVFFIGCGDGEGVREGERYRQKANSDRVNFSPELASQQKTRTTL